jgi:hypothetical protein
MQTDTILKGILALLVAERDGSGGRSTARLLADAGLTGDDIAMVTGRDPAQFDAPPVAAFGQASEPAAAAVSRSAAR